jgi:hypothetical protein
MWGRGVQTLKLHPDSDRRHYASVKVAYVHTTWGALSSTYSQGNDWQTSPLWDLAYVWRYGSSLV